MERKTENKKPRSSECGPSQVTQDACSCEQAGIEETVCGQMSFKAGVKNWGVMDGDEVTCAIDEVNQEESEHMRSFR